MPELPEVESVARKLRENNPSLVGQRINFVDVQWSGVISDGYGQVVSLKLEGCRFEAVERHGKYLLFRLECPQHRSRTLVIHLRMTGRLYLLPEGEAVVRHTRLVLMLDNDLALRFDDPRKFGRVWLVDDPGEVTATLGPDALTIESSNFSDRLVNRRRQIKPLLLDQSVLAGIGNIYADEILFRAGLHPCIISSNLTLKEVRLLHSAVISVLQEAVEAQGANLNGVFKAGRFVVSVYGRQGRPCPMCGSAIIKFRLGQRGTHVCPNCQILR